MAALSIPPQELNRVYAGRPTSPDPGSLTIRPIQTPGLPMQHPQPQSVPAAPSSPWAAEQHAMQMALASSTPPPRPARAPLRSPSRSPASDAVVKLIQKAHENSKDGGETLDLSRERIERISDEDVEVFRTRVGKHNQGVWRLALSYNQLHDGCIAPSFCTLNRLRYLNLKGNHLTVIPPALCEMQGLEILDVSKNQITSLPDSPGRLTSLKVLSLSNNALTKLPTYLVTFNNLKVFKVDHNPIEWPPREILGPLVDAEPAGRRAAGDSGEQRKGREEDLRPWIEGMKIWLQEQITDSVGYHVPETQPLQTIKRNRAATVSEDSLIPAKIHHNTSTLSLPAQETRHDRSISSSSSPPISASTSSSGPPSAGLPRLPPPVPAPAHPPIPGHNRGGSYTVPHRLNGNLAAKKSLPDLRKSHAKIIEERSDIRSDIRSPIDLSRTRKVSDVKIRKAMDSTQPRPKDPPADLERRTSNPDTPSLDESRNSYFRRVSMLPPSTISKAVSPAMLMFIDAVRGLLFALTQLHSALRQYVNFAVSDRVVGVFARVLEPAGGYLSNLINALDRFDSTSRRTAPPVAAVRGVIDAAKESIAVFGKIVAVLRFQTPAFKDADVRYTRQLLLNIYGGMAEIAQSWKTMAPLLIEIKPILHPETGKLPVPMSKSNSMQGRTPISPIPESGESHSPDRAMRGNAALFASPRGKSRRHAGSFSTEDVERGMLMGSPVTVPRNDWPDLSRTIFEDNEAMADTAPPPFPLNAGPEPPHMTPPHRDALPPIMTSFSRGRHAAMSSAGSSFLYPVANGGVRSLSVDVRPPTPASATLFDEDLLDQIETATDIAFTVWLRLSEDIGGGSYLKSDSISSAVGFKPLPPKQHHELVGALSRAEQVTTTLRESLMGLRANPFAYAHASLPENAQAFIKQVVKVLEQVKVISASHTFSVNVRQALSQLTQATRECAILIQVSSLQPTASMSSVNLNSAVDDPRDRVEAAQSQTDFSRPGPDFKPNYKPDFKADYKPDFKPDYKPDFGRERDFNKDFGRMEFTPGESSSNEDLVQGLRGLHLPRARELRERVR